MPRIIPLPFQQPPNRLPRRHRLPPQHLPHQPIRKPSLTILNTLKPPHQLPEEPLRFAPDIILRVDPYIRLRIDYLDLHLPISRLINNVHYILRRHRLRRSQQHDLSIMTTLQHQLSRCFRQLRPKRECDLPRSRRQIEGR